MPFAYTLHLFVNESDCEKLHFLLTSKETKFKFKYFFHHALPP